MIDISVYLSYGEGKLKAGRPQHNVFKLARAFEHSSSHRHGELCTS
jgi:hypothetical protein